jgi:hypothetical protein
VEPPLPADALPDANIKQPVFAPLLDPELKTRRPDFPAEPELHEKKQM